MLSTVTPLNRNAGMARLTQRHGLPAPAEVFIGSGVALVLVIVSVHPLCCPARYCSRIASRPSRGSAQGGFG